LGCSNTAAIYLDLISPTSSSLTPITCNTYTAPDGAIYNVSGAYTAVIPNAVGCDSTITINLTVHLSNSGTDNRTICDSLIWIDGITYYSDNNSTTFTVQNSNGCDSVVTLNLTVNKLTSLVAGADLTVCKGESVTLIASGPEIISWNGGVSNGVAFVPSASSYFVTGTDANGCQATDEVNLIIEDCFSIPPAFSPNGDNANDTWNVTGLGNYKDSEIQVYDRWGQKVFSGNSSSAYWDGKLNGNELPSADYYYIVTLGNGENFNGVVTLKR
jgi:gliding motility-associated-like protein